MISGCCHELWLNGFDTAHERHGPCPPEASVRQEDMDSLAKSAKEETPP